MIWILVAHRAHALLFQSSKKNRETQLLRKLEYPEGRRQNREIDTDAKGSRYSTTASRGNSTTGKGPNMQMKHGLDPHIEAVEHLSDIFAKELAIILRDGRTHNNFSEAILIAEPGFLGKIRKFLDKETSSMVSATVNRNLTSLSLTEIVHQLEEVIHSTRRVA